MKYNVVECHANVLAVCSSSASRLPIARPTNNLTHSLNALANHGYIHRSGVTGLVDTVAAIHQVYGMGLELGLLLAIMGVVWSGNPLSLDPSFSIGGNSTAVYNALDNAQGLLGTPQGIEHSHNWLEADASPTRDDLYQTGDSWTMNMTRFQQLYDTVPASEDFSFDVLSKWSADRWHESVETNPYFYYGPFTGMIARNAGFFFVGRLFANHTEGSTEGKLSESAHAILSALQDHTLTTHPQPTKPSAPSSASTKPPTASNTAKATSKSRTTGSTRPSTTASCSSTSTPSP
jgi:hypothetical protein